MSAGVAIAPTRSSRKEVNHGLNSVPPRVKPEIGSYLCNHCKLGQHHLHVPVTTVGKCECFICSDDIH